MTSLPSHFGSRPFRSALATYPFPVSRSRTIRLQTNAFVVFITFKRGFVSLICLTSGGGVAIGAEFGYSGVGVVEELIDGGGRGGPGGPGTADLLPGRGGGPDYG